MPQAFDALIASLDTRGIRESYLHSVLTKIEMSFKEALRRSAQIISGSHSAQNMAKKEAGEGSSSPECDLGTESPRSTVCYPGSEALDPSTSFKIELGQNDREKNAALKRYRDFQNWSWKECFGSSPLCAAKYGKKRCSELLGVCLTCYECFLFEEKQCPSCCEALDARQGAADENLTEDMPWCEKQKVDPRWSSKSSRLSHPARIQMLKAQLSLVEVPAVVKLQYLASLSFPPPPFFLFFLKFSSRRLATSPLVPSGVCRFPSLRRLFNGSGPTIIEDLGVLSCSQRRRLKSFFR